MNSSFFDIDNITLGAWLDIWFEKYKKPVLKPYSVRNIEQMIRIHTPEWLKAMPMQKIRLMHIDSALCEIPLGRTRAYAKQVWHSAFLKAQKLEIIDKNVVSLVDSIKYQKKRSKALSIVEQEKFIQALENSRYKWIMLFYLHTGVRRTEALTLRWEDIDRESNLILIRGTKTTDSYRHILLTDDLKYILDMQRKQNRKERRTHLKSKNPHLVFDYADATVSHAFKKLCPNHHLHDLRHTFITRCAECGVNVAVCQQLVGHATADMTMNVYTHVMDEFKRKEALKFSLNPSFHTKP